MNYRFGVVLLATSFLAGRSGSLRADWAKPVVRTLAMDDSFESGEAVQTGIDVLEAQNFALLRGKRIGLVTNQTGRTSDGRMTTDVLFKAPGVKLVALFGPEHGVRGDVSAGRMVRGGRDPRTKVPIYSLYGSTKRPTAAMLRGIDTLVFDMQDIGSRSYTFISTMGECMAACAANGRRFVVLDRPNPLGGELIEGNYTSPRFRSFVSAFPIPYRHGLTVGELARLLNGKGWLPGKKACRLNVVPMRNYRRDMLVSSTGLPWVRTSPNIPYARSPFFYAATGMVGELSGLSIGIGTPWPFEIAGAPGLNAAALAARLKGRHIPGVTFKPVSWKPTRGAYRGRYCNGVQIVLTDAEAATLTRINFELMGAVRHIAPQIKFFGRRASQNRMFDLVCGTDSVRRSFSQGATAAQIWRNWNRDSASFATLRQRYLLYP